MNTWRPVPSEIAVGVHATYEMCQLIKEVQLKFGLQGPKMTASVQSPASSGGNLKRHHLENVCKLMHHILKSGAWNPPFGAADFRKKKFTTYVRKEATAAFHQFHKKLKMHFEGAWKLSKDRGNCNDEKFENM